jgi:hypothetical protein
MVCGEFQICYFGINVSEQRTATIFEKKAVFYPEDGGTMFLRNHNIWCRNAKEFLLQ